MAAKASETRRASNTNEHPSVLKERLGPMMQRPFRGENTDEAKRKETKKKSPRYQIGKKERDRKSRQARRGSDRMHIENLL